jgi:hypothetical protein
MIGLLRRLGILTIGGLGWFHGRADYPGEAHGIEIPLHARGGGQPPAAGQIVAPQEANLIAQAAQKRDRVAGVVRARMAPLDGALNALDHDLARLLRDFAAARAQRAALGPEEFRAALPTWLYWALVAILLYFEVALNKAALDHLGVDEVIAWESSIFISAVSFVAAKSTARVLRQRTWRSGGWPDILLAGATNAVFLASLAFVGLLRAADAGGQGDAAFYWLMLTGGYLAIMLASFLQIDPNGARARLDLAVARLTRAKQAKWVRRSREAARRDSLLARGERLLSEIEGDLSERSAQYRDGNLRGRASAPPSYFRQAISLAALAEIDLGRPVDAHPATAPATELADAAAEDHQDADVPGAAPMLIAEPLPPKSRGHAPHEESTR